MNKRGQIWSMDMVIGVVIFLFLVTVFLSFLISTEPEEFDVRSQADSIFQRFDTSSGRQLIPPIFDGNRLNQQALEDLYGGNYLAIRRQMQITGEFCIVIVDQTGGLVPINTSDGEKYVFGGTNFENVRVADGIFC